MYILCVRRGRLTEADLTYIAANYLTLDALCAHRSESAADMRKLIDEGRLPRPSYVLDDGSGMFPADYFRLVDEAGGIEALHAHFAARYEAASQTERAHVDELDKDWVAYMNGIYGICLCEVTPEAIVHKTVLVSSICELMMLPRSRCDDWRRDLRVQVDQLDALERDFAPDYDRSEEQDRLPTRDLLVNAAHARFPDVFTS
jgi:hypothetical protein